MPQHRAFPGGSLQSMKISIHNLLLSSPPHLAGSQQKPGAGHVKHSCSSLLSVRQVWVYLTIGVVLASIATTFQPNGYAVSLGKQSFQFHTFDFCPGLGNSKVSGASSCPSSFRVCSATWTCTGSLEPTCDRKHGRCGGIHEPAATHMGIWMNAWPKNLRHKLQEVTCYRASSSACLAFSHS